MFFGEFSGRIGKDGRVYLPKKLRGEIKGRVFITESPDGCLLLYRQKKKNSIKRNMNKYGMILILKFLRVYAGLKKEIVILGCRRRIEIWNPEKWAEEEERVEIRKFEKFIEEEF